MDSKNSPLSNRSSNSQLSRGGVSVDNFDNWSHQLETSEALIVHQALHPTHLEAPATGLLKSSVQMSNASQVPAEELDTSDLEATAPSPGQENDAMLSTKIISLQVGERQFTTHVSTLIDQSDYFKSIFSGRWTVPRLENDSYFLDADGDVFGHIIRFLRHQVYPVVYDRAGGHDYAIYMAILNLAEFLGISKLVTWIKDQRFHKAVTTTYRIEHDTSFPRTSFPGISNFSIENTNSDQKCFFYPLLRTRKVYLCPRRIVVHRGAPDRCGQACVRARGDLPYEYEEEDVLDLLKVSERTVFNPTGFNDSSA